MVLAYVFSIMLNVFLLKNQEEILSMTQSKSKDMAGDRVVTEHLKEGLRIFLKQLIDILQLEKSQPPSAPLKDKSGMARAARDSDEVAMAKATGRPEDAEVAKTAAIHGTELLRLGYTLSHVVHSYGDMCQSITELADQKKIVITPNEFHDLNRSLDVAIAGAVTQYQSLQNTQEVEHLGFLSHELRNALIGVNLSLQLIKKGTVGFGGSTGRVLDGGLKRIEELIDRSLTELRLRVDPQVHIESIHLLRLVDQIMVTAKYEARSKNQFFEVRIDPNLIFEGDYQLIYSAMSNLIHNALNYTQVGGEIQVRGKSVEDDIIIEVEDGCGGLSKTAAEIFKPFVKQNENRKGLGLGLTIAQRAIELNHGRIELRNRPGEGCIFQITLPKKQKVNRAPGHKFL